MVQKNEERRVYEYIIKRYNAGFLPSVRDICSELGFASAATAQRYIEKLCEKGMLIKQNNSSRSVRPKAAGAALIPLLTDNAALSGEYICWGAAYGRTERIFAVKPTFGMPDAAILPGDTVIAERCKSLPAAAFAVIRKPDGTIGISKGTGGELLGKVIAVQRVVL